MVIVYMKELTLSYGGAVSVSNIYKKGGIDGKGTDGNTKH